MVALSSGALWATVLAADHPERVDSIVYVGPGVTLVSNHPERDVSPFEDAVESDPEWANAGGLLASDYVGFLEFFFGRCFAEPHSSKQIEDCVGWALETTPRTILDTIVGIGLPREELFRETCARVRCRTLVIHGERDLIRPHAQGEALARATGGDVVTTARLLQSPCPRERQCRRCRPRRRPASPAASVGAARRARD